MLPEMDERPLPPYMVYDRQLLVRRRAVRIMSVSGPIAVAVAVLLAVGSARAKGTWLEHLMRPELLFVAATPAVAFLFGLVSFLSSRSREELEAAWNGLRGWQRGLLGLGVVVFALGIVFFTAAVVLGGR